MIQVMQGRLTRLYSYLHTIILTCKHHTHVSQFDHVVLTMPSTISLRCAVGISDDIKNMSDESQMTLWICWMSLRCPVWISDDIKKYVGWVSNAWYETQMTQENMWDESQMQHMNLRPHKKICWMSLKCVVWISDNPKNMWDESQMQHMNLRPHKKYVGWVSNAWYESQTTQKICRMSLRCTVWISDDIKKYVGWVSNVWYESQMTQKICGMSLRCTVWISDDIKNMLDESQMRGMNLRWPKKYVGWVSDAAYESQTT